MSQFLLFFGGGEQWARIFKKVQVKKTREIKLINFTKKKIGQIPFFAISKMTKNAIS